MEHATDSRNITTVQMLRAFIEDNLPFHYRDEEIQVYEHLKSCLICDTQVCGVSTGSQGSILIDFSLPWKNLGNISKSDCLLQDRNCQHLVPKSHPKTKEGPFVSILFWGVSVKIKYYFNINRIKWKSSKIIFNLYCSCLHSNLFVGILSTSFLFIVLLDF